VVESARPAATAASPRLAADLAAVGALWLILVLFMLPALTGRAPVLASDAYADVLPHMIHFARSTQHGQLPLWDGHTFAGAKPFFADYTRMYQVYPVLLPFYLAADTEDPDRAAWLLMVLPNALHLLSSALGAYLFARLGMRLHPAGGLALALAWTFAPSQAGEWEWPPHVFVRSYLPWIALIQARYLDTGRLRWWTGGIAAVALMTLSGQFNYVFRVYCIGGIMLLAQWLLGAHDGHPVAGPAPPAPGREAFAAWFAPRRAAGPRLLGGVLIYVLGAGICGLTLAGMFEGCLWIRQFIEPGAAAATKYSFSSAPPVSLLTLVTSHLAFDVDKLNAAKWGGDYQDTTDFAGGLVPLLLLLTVAAFLAWSRAESAARRLAQWGWIAAGVFLLGVFVVLGDHTPVFGLLCAIAPWAFGIPYAMNYNFAIHWGLALVAGVGVSALATLPAFRDRFAAWWLAAVCVAIAVAAWGGVLQGQFLVPDATQGTPEELAAVRIGGVLWYKSFVYGVGFFAAAAALLCAGLAALPGRGRVWLVVALLGIEVVSARALTVYRADWYQPFDVEGDGEGFGRNIRSPFTEYIPYRICRQLVERMGDDRYRWTSFSGQIDNQAYTTRSRSLLGFESKPLLPRWCACLERFTDGALNPTMALQLTTVPQTFFRNMNTRYCLLHPREARLPLEVFATLDGFPVYEIPDCLPAVYTQDRVVFGDAESQLDALFTQDLRQAVYVSDADEPAVPAGTGDATGAAGGFAALQRANRIEALDRSRCDRTTIRAQITRPAMLVIAECWHPGWRATVDGLEVPLWQVNYIQQGLWLEPGSHTVELTFFPDSMRYGAVASALAAGAVLAAVAVTVVRRRSGARRRDADAA